MSESTGGTTLVQPEVEDYVEIEVNLKFVSRDYTPEQLATRIQDVDALMKLLIYPRTVLNGKPLPGKARNPIRGFHGRSSAAGRRQIVVDSVTGRYTNFGRNTSRSTVSPRAVKISVETVSLNSPLEITLLVTLVAGTVLTRFTKIMPKLIDIKNSWHASQVVAAESKARIDRARLASQFINQVAQEVGNVNLDKFAELDDKHESKMIVMGAVRALTDLESAEAHKNEKKK